VSYSFRAENPQHNFIKQDTHIALNCHEIHTFLCKNKISNNCPRKRVCSITTGSCSTKISSGRALSSKNLAKDIQASYYDTPLLKIKKTKNSTACVRRFSESRSGIPRSKGPLQPQAHTPSNNLHESCWPRPATSATPDDLAIPHSQRGHTQVHTYSYNRFIP